MASTPETLKFLTDGVMALARKASKKTGEFAARVISGGDKSEIKISTNDDEVLKTLKQQIMQNGGKFLPGKNALAATLPVNRENLTAFNKTLNQYKSKKH